LGKGTEAEGRTRNQATAGGGYFRGGSGVSEILFDGHKVKLLSTEHEIAYAACLGRKKVCVIHRVGCPWQWETGELAQLVSRLDTEA
jgi:hypothetical protein